MYTRMRLIIKELKTTIELILCECGCGLTRPRYDVNNNERRFIQGHNSKLAKLENNNNWKGGKTYHSRGYILLCKPDHPKASKTGYVYEHRYVYEQYYKCCLLDCVDIHHINGIRNDNRIENLEPMSKSKHVSNHFKKDMSDRQCILCGTKKTCISIYAKWYKYNNGLICDNCYQKNKRKKLGYGIAGQNSSTAPSPSLSILS